MILSDIQIAKNTKINRKLLSESKELGDTYMKLPLNNAENFLDTLESLVNQKEAALACVQTAQTHCCPLCADYLKEAENSLKN